MHTSSFNQYLTESLDIEKLKHLEHIEDHILHGGHEGVHHASETLSDVLAALEGKSRKFYNKSTKITQKYDGAPAIIFGVDPTTGKFFVGTKSVFNVKPKLNFSERDVEENHGDKPELAKKLKIALKELPKIMPREGGIYQGDLMYTKDDLIDKNNDYSFTPNLVTYTAKKDSTHGRNISTSNLGIVIHSRYIGKDLKSSKVTFDVDQNAFVKDPSVYTINPDVTNADISPIEKTQYEKQVEQLLSQYKNLPDDIFNVVDGHDILIKTYINDCVRNDSTPSGKDYLRFVTDRLDKEIAEKKSEKTIETKKQKKQVLVSHIKNHIDQFNSIFQLHSGLQAAKNTLIGALSRSQTGFKTTIGGKEVKPEGFVAIRNGRPSKLVDRAEFSRSNFLMGQFRKLGEKEPKGEDKPTKPIVFTFGRMNPPTAGHKAVSDKVQEIARENKADSEVVLTRSHDPEKNPLSPEQKEKHAKRVLGSGAKIRVADQSEKTILDQVKRYHKNGYDHLVLVVGSDRVEEMKKLLDKYNGTEYKFKKIDVVSAGNRDPDSDDETQAISGTKMRGHAISRRFEDFRSGLPSTVAPEHANELYNEVRQAMDIKIDQNTSGISLARYAKRNDPIGAKARREIKRREREKEIQKQAERSRRAVARRSTIREDIGSGDVGGLGFNSGNPAVVSSAVSNYTERNTADSEQVNDLLFKIMHNYHHKYITKPMRVFARRHPKKDK